MATLGGFSMVIAVFGFRSATLLLLRQSKYWDLLLPKHTQHAAVSMWEILLLHICLKQPPYITYMNPPVADLYRWSWGRRSVLKLLQQALAKYLNVKQQTHCLLIQKEPIRLCHLEFHDRTYDFIRIAKGMLHHILGRNYCACCLQLVNGNLQRPWFCEETALFISS